MRPHLLAATLLAASVALPARAEEPLPVSPPAERKKITITAKDAPFRMVIEQFFVGSSEFYTIGADVPDVPVTLSLRDVSLPSALRVVVRLASAQVPGLTLSHDGEVYNIRIKRPVPDEGPPADVVGVDLLWEKIKLRFQEVSAVVHLLGGTPAPGGGSGPGRRESAAAPRGDAPKPGSALSRMIGERDGTGGMGLSDISVPDVVPDGIRTVLGIAGDNSLLVRGTPDGIEALKSILRLLDVPPSQVRVRVSAGDLAAEGQALSGSALALTDVTGANRLEVSVIPRLNGDGTVEVDLEGTLTTAGRVRSLKSRVRVSSDQSIKVASLGEGPRQVQIWIRATPLPEGAARGGMAGRGSGPAPSSRPAFSKPPRRP
jgi:hypothetical protein